MLLDHVRCSLQTLRETDHLHPQSLAWGSWAGPPPGQGSCRSLWSLIFELTVVLEFLAVIAVVI